MDNHSPGLSTLPIICEVTLPEARAPELLQLLAGVGVTAASVFPGYDGALRALIEERYWEHPNEFASWDEDHPSQPWQYASTTGAA